ncbi:unnamed protein product [Colias eurytheme]|nr:unnamed protein product [Colias eurytheme]
MPLLKRKAFEKSTASGFLRDDDEVFHCEITDEIFKDYEEYCERIILVNSMVWTCEMTGKNNLTYSEALESEKAARRSLKDFPMELRIPILYLATKTKRSSFAEMSEDVFNFVRERFFVGESVEACLEGDIWREAHILSVTAQKQHPDNKEIPPPSAYCYEVEQYEESDATAVGQIGTAPYERIRRRKGVYSRDKNRLFLKQFVEMGPVIAIKASAIDKYNINKVHFDQIFTGSPPEFPSSKKLKMSMSPSVKPGSASKLNKSVKKISPQKGRQESMDKFVKKTDKAEVNKTKTINPEAKKNAQDLADKMRRAEEQLRLRKEEEKAKKKEKTARVMAYMKEWQKVKDDLELEDHKVLPKGTPILMDGIDSKHFGDLLSVLDFVHTFSEVLKAKDVFPNDLDLEMFRKALTMKESAGVFCDLIQMFLSAIFSLQEDEAEEYNERGGIQESTEDQQDTEMGLNRAIELATKASKWSHTYLGTPLAKLPLDPSTVSEVLRLHLLSSGSEAGGRCIAWRCHQRGGYSSADDPGLRLRLQRPGLLRRLASAHVAALPIDDKFAILQCLMSQVLSYATVRDLVEERLEEHRNLKQALRTLQINERKREPQLSSARMEVKREAAAKKEEQKLTGDKAKQLDEQVKVDIDKLMKDNETKKQEYLKKSKELQMQLFEYTNFIGMDRAFNRYWVSRRVGGLFVEAVCGPLRGPCRAKPVPRPPRAPADAPDLLAYVTDLYHAGRREREGSDKENESGSNSRGNSPKKPLTNVNGVTKMSPDSIQHMRDLMVCTADVNTCYVHGKNEGPTWWVYNTEEQLDALMQALNKRGAREAELRHALDSERDGLRAHLARCPLHALNMTVPQPSPVAQPATRRRGPQPSLVVPEDCSLAEALELAFRDQLLELEEKIHHGCLGALKVKDREAWRGTIMLRSYDKQAEYLSWGPNGAFRDDTHLPDGRLVTNGDIKEDPEDPDTKEILENKYRDPGYYLDTAKPNGVKLEPSEGYETKPEVIRGLASALLQISQGIHHKYLKRPLGLDDKERKDREAKNKPLDLEALERWEVSLMGSRSVAGLTLHALALEHSVSWAASVLHASCRLCRRRTDPDNMLLCDGCNKGHHLYCLKPPLAKVPEGDWFCDQCKPKEKTPRKRRKLYTDEEIEDELDESSEPVSLGVCATCGSGGVLAACSACGARHHPECARPRPARASRRWTCERCLRHEPPSRRRCAAAAMSSIHQYARSVHKRSRSTDSEDSEFNTALVKLKTRKSRGSKESSPLTNGNSKRGRRSKEELNDSSSRRGKSSLTNGVHEERSSRKRGRGVVLHTDALAQLLKDALKHKDSWPFHEPVSTEDVPDYLQVIDTPMDLNTVREKLEAGQYERDDQVLSDVALVFHNCYTYNQDSHPVAKAGYRLEKYIIKRCKELELPPLPESNPTDDEDLPLKRSIKEDSEDAPKSKKSKLQ